MATNKLLSSTKLIGVFFIMLVCALPANAQFLRTSYFMAVSYTHLTLPTIA